METKELQRIASQVRRDIVRMVAGVNSGHPGGSLGCADFLTMLYFDTMKHSTEFTMDGKGRIYSSYLMAIFLQFGIAF